MRPLLHSLSQHGVAGGVGGRRLNRLEVHLLLVVSAGHPPPVTEGLCCPLFSPFPHLLDDLIHFLLASICCQFSGAGNIFHRLCPLDSSFHCNKDYDIHNSSFMSSWQGSPGRRGPQGEQGEPGPKVSPDTQHYCGFVCFGLCRRREAGVRLNVFIPALSWAP